MVAANTVGFTVTFIFPGRIGEIVKPLYLARKESIRQGLRHRDRRRRAHLRHVHDVLLPGALSPGPALCSRAFDVAPEAYGRLTFWGIVGVAFALASSS